MVTFSKFFPSTDVTLAFTSIIPWKTGNNLLRTILKLCPSVQFHRELPMEIMIACVKY